MKKCGTNSNIFLESEKEKSECNISYKDKSKMLSENTAEPDNNETP